MHIFTSRFNFSKVSRILLSLLTLLIFQTGFALAQDAPFITVWQTDNPGSSEDNQITIPGTGTDYLIEWEEVGNEANNNGSETGTDEHTITFPSAGTYRVKISGDFTQINLQGYNNQSDNEKILDIEQWGDIAWSTFRNAFFGCKNLLHSATDAPDLTNVTNMNGMFLGADSFNGNIGNWIVSNVTVMRSMFLGANSFDQDLSNWDVSNVTDMGSMFSRAYSFNQDLSNWNVSNVINMYQMFNYAESFNQDLGNWNVSNVTVMTAMFANTAAFNQNLNSWNTVNVEEMNFMFYGANAFNGNIGNWNTSNVTNMTEMFRETSSFNQDLSNWNVSNVNEMSGMFYDATAFDQNLGDWNLSNAGSLFEFLTSSGMSTQNYDLSLEGWATNGNIASDIALSAEGLYYCASAEYRQQLIDNFGWNIMGDETCSLAIQETIPSAEATSVEKDTEIHLTFDQEIEKLDFSGITLKDISGNAISLTDIYIDSLTLHLVHNGLGSNTYEVIIPESSIVSITGKKNDSISWSFATQRILSSNQEQKQFTHTTYPNPFSDFTTIQFNLPQTQSVKLLVFDLKGQIVRKEQYDNLGSDNQSIKFERKDLPAGLYRYQLQSAGGSVGGKMLIE